MCGTLSYDRGRRPTCGALENWQTGRASAKRGSTMPMFCPKIPKFHLFVGNFCASGLEEGSPRPIFDRCFARLSPPAPETCVSESFGVCSMFLRSTWLCSMTSQPQFWNRSSCHGCAPSPSMDRGSVVYVRLVVDQRPKTSGRPPRRAEGVPLLMRVVHVLQLKVTSIEAAAKQKFLFQMWQQGADGQIRNVNRTMARTLL